MLCSAQMSGAPRDGVERHFQIVQLAVMNDACSLRYIGSKPREVKSEGSWRRLAANPGTASFHLASLHHVHISHACYVLY